MIICEAIVVHFANNNSQVTEHIFRYLKGKKNRSLHAWCGMINIWFKSQLDILNKTSISYSASLATYLFLTESTYLILKKKKYLFLKIYSNCVLSVSYKCFLKFVFINRDTCLNQAFLLWFLIDVSSLFINRWFISK